MAYGGSNKSTDAAAEIGRNSVSKHQIHACVRTEMSRLTRDGTAEPVSRDQISGANEYREISIFPVNLTKSRISNLTQLIPLLLYVCVTIQVRVYHTKYIFILKQN